MVKQFAELITSENGVYFIVGTLFLLALINWVRFSYRINPCIKDMDSAVKSFSEIKPDEGEEDLNLEEFFAFYYKEYGEKISKIDILIHPWSEFTETLLRMMMRVRY